MAIQALAGAGCGDDGSPDGGTVVNDIDDVAIEQELVIPGLAATVDVLQDERGMWHIYGENLDDVLAAQGYLAARDRMGQMEFIRRATTGRLAELAGSIDTSLVEMDEAARFAGHARIAAALLSTLSPEELAPLEAFARGVNAYIAELRDGRAELARGVVELMPPEIIDDWTVIDTLSIARFQAHALSNDAEVELSLSAAKAAIETTFPADSSDPRIAARAAVLHDFYALRPLFDGVSPLPGFPNEGVDSGSRALVRPPATTSAEMPPPSLAMLQAGAAFMKTVSAMGRRIFGPRESRGSNGWAIAGAKTASGNAILASDPHLSITSPSLFWYVHLNTARHGGSIDAQGLSLVGTPGILLGYNRHIAWGATNSYFDVTDLYHEAITAGVDGAPDTVTFNGEQVAIEIINERILLDSGATLTLRLERVPHHGLIIPTTRTETEAISVRWVGDVPSNEFGAILDVLSAESIEEARLGLDGFAVGAQIWLFADTHGETFLTGQSQIPVRDPRALTYDATTRTGVAPSFVLPGTGEYEWIGFLEDRYIPHASTPASGFVAAANTDPVGSNADGNPFNDDHYLGWFFAPGGRFHRIGERLTELTDRGSVTAVEAHELQNDTRSALGSRLTATLLAELDRGQAELATSGTHADLTAAVEAIGEEGMAKLATVAERLRSWTFATPDGVEGSEPGTEPSAEEIDASISTTLFNVALNQLVVLTFADEVERLDIEPLRLARPLAWALSDPARLSTYDSVTGGTVLWDDIDTEEVESRGDRILRAFAAAVAMLEAKLGTDMNQWRWGKLHTLTAGSLVPQITRDVLSLPTPEDPVYPGGYPRHGDLFAVDASNYDERTEAGDYSYRWGPVQRLVVEMTPEGPVATNAIPGGASIDPDSPHHADEMELWRRNQTGPMHFVESDVAAHAERHWRLGGGAD